MEPCSGGPLFTIMAVCPIKISDVTRPTAWTVLPSGWSTLIQSLRRTPENTASFPSWILCPVLPLGSLETFCVFLKRVEKNRSSLEHPPRPNPRVDLCADYRSEASEL